MGTQVNNKTGLQTTSRPVEQVPLFLGVGAKFLGVNDGHTDIQTPDIQDWRCLWGLLYVLIYFQFFLLIWRRESPCGALQRGFYLHALTVRFRGRFWTSFLVVFRGGGGGGGGNKITELFLKTLFQDLCSTFQIIAIKLHTLANLVKCEL